MAVSLAFQTSLGPSSSTGTNPYTFAAVPFGTAAADRLIIVGVFGTGTTLGITSVTIGGVAATQIVLRLNGSSNGALSAIYLAAVPTGTTGDIVITFSTTTPDRSVGVWSVTGLQNISAIDTDTSIAQPSTATLDTVDDGFCIAIRGDSTSTSYTSSGGVTERFDFNPRPGSTTFTGADGSTNGLTTITPSISAAASSREAAVFATFGNPFVPIFASSAELPAGLTEVPRMVGYDCG